MRNDKNPKKKVCKKKRAAKFCSGIRWNHMGLKTRVQGIQPRRKKEGRRIRLKKNSSGERVPWSRNGPINLFWIFLNLNWNK